MPILRADSPNSPTDSESCPAQCGNLPNHKNKKTSSVKGYTVGSPPKHSAEEFMAEPYTVATQASGLKGITD